ncbi:20S-pre-rRNA D-site endonuclease nob1 [Elasticomyces elasticus]|uniref:20S-pre-rRNA D-site endonuclease NOB1 n=1 Tax=Exophiala sideris TaxID=1016849 RepID=A0ABR0JN93_9EURO|nr:20S-pre-rRNA D-site endonuclease nob1 [Elasticomyces elasticus]KAK5037768.1 20S-pre-rRNA D-site endonuclease nob1 [Exophiala sideris]KAK5043750.1 20S-pre-rRNA D-site endonuclease nob1 [Exophiala sideris]KAK5067249.1 20S-pre-rRNA D-site endonuclease nob1 [Exophiala sideris]KAK5182582.1 20S-pre-rRNA D-site endonuclease nob1 [Eurotiomycetes sp. CCFEE 6388]
MSQMKDEKPIHTIILDASPLLLNTPGISTLLANGHVLVTTPSVLAEIRTEEARTRVETLYKPFLEIRTPKPESVKHVREFARRTGDGAVLSQTDFEVIALAYDIECERNGGDWRLRAVPGQKRVNGSPPQKTTEQSDETSDPTPENATAEEPQGKVVQASREDEEQPGNLESQVQSLSLQDTTAAEQQSEQEIEVIEVVEDGDAEQDGETQPDEEEPDSDEGWITPSNIKKKQAKDEAANTKSKSETKHLQVATMTGDFALQNVLLQMNLNLLSSKTCQRISQIKQFLLRCHGCFGTTKEMNKQFCPRCGQPTLTRVSCTTNDKGEVKLHLKANMQWNNRGNVYSIPKPIHGSANQKYKGPRQGGGQGGWGDGLILAEDQKEYIRAMTNMKRTKEKNLMDEDTLPSILTGDRGQGSGRTRIGGGRTINSRKR